MSLCQCCTLDQKANNSVNISCAHRAHDYARTYFRGVHASDARTQDRTCARREVVIGVVVVMVVVVGVVVVVVMVVAAALV